MSTAPSPAPRVVVRPPSTTSASSSSRRPPPPRSNVFASSAAVASSGPFRPSFDGASASLSSSHRLIEAALAENPSAFDFDDEEAELRERKEGHSTVPRPLPPPPPPSRPSGSRYIGGLLKAAEQRVREREAGQQRTAGKERRAEEAEWGVREHFVTRAYRQHVEEAEEQRRRAEAEEAKEAKLSGDSPALRHLTGTARLIDRLRDGGGGREEEQQQSTAESPHSKRRRTEAMEGEGAAEQSPNLIAATPTVPTDVFEAMAAADAHRPPPPPPPLPVPPPDPFPSPALTKAAEARLRYLQRRTQQPP